MPFRKTNLHARPESDDEIQGGYRQSDRFSFSPSLLANSLLFYDEVELFGSDEDLGLLVSMVGLEEVSDLLQSGRLNFSLMKNRSWVRYDGGKEFKKSAAFSNYSFEGRGKPPRATWAADNITRSEANDYSLFFPIERHLRASGRRHEWNPVTAYQICDRVRIRTLEEYGLEAQFDAVEVAIDMLMDSKRSATITRSFVETLLGPRVTPADARVQIRPSKGFAYSANFDIRNLLASCSHYGQPVSKDVFVATLLNHTAYLAEVAYVSINNESDLASSGHLDPLFDLFLKPMEERTRRGKEAELLMELRFDSASAVGDAIASGVRTWRDLIDLIEKREAFSKWLSSIPPDTTIAAEYMRYLRSDTWVNRLPGKALRYTFFAGAGLTADVAFAGGLGTLSALGIGAFDSFCMDRILAGWKPASFIDERVGGFVGPSAKK